MDFCKNVLHDLYRKYIKKHHRFILCKYEKKKSVKLKVVIDNHRMVILAKPYGFTHHSYLQGFTRPSEFAIAIIRALLALIAEIHSAGYSLDGNLQIKNLHWLPNKTLKLRGLKRGALRKRRDLRAKRDFFAAYDFIQDILFEGCAVPYELAELMELLHDDPVTYQELILNNIILLDDVQKVGEYISCFQKLQQLQKYNLVIYRLALTYIKKKRDWKADVKGNSALNSVFTFNNGASYANVTNEEGCTIFGRHCCSHLLDYSVDEVRQIILFSMADQFAMIECFVPGLF